MNGLIVLFDNDSCGNFEVIGQGDIQEAKYWYLRRREKSGRIYENCAIIPKECMMDVEKRLGKQRNEELKYELEITKEKEKQEYDRLKKKFG